MNHFQAAAARFTGALVAAAWVAGCGGASDTLGVTNVEPRGSVGGRVVDAATMTALAGVKVQVIAGGAQLPAGGAASTDDTGRFAINDVPAGNLLVRIEGPPTHAPVELAATLQNAAGEFPLNNATASLGPIGLVPLTDAQSALKLRLVMSDGSAAAAVKAQARATLGWIDFTTTPLGKPEGALVASAASDAMGLISFEGLPDFAKIAGRVGLEGLSDAIEIRVPPFDRDGDGAFDYHGGSFSVAATAPGQAIPTLVLAAPTVPTLQIVATTLPALAGEVGSRTVPVGGAVFVTFNQPVSAERSEATLHDESGLVLTKPTLKASGTTLVINFADLKAGGEYNLSLWVSATVEERLIEAPFGAPFFTPPEADQKITVTMTKDPAVAGRVNVRFSEPLGAAGAKESVPVFFDFDVDGSGAKGDAPGEFGAASSGYPLVSAEPNPPGEAGLSGLTTRWSLSVPDGALSGAPLPKGTVVRFAFAQANKPIIRGDGRLAADLTTTLP